MLPQAADPAFAIQPPPAPVRSPSELLDFANAARRWMEVALHSDHPAARPPWTWKQLRDAADAAWGLWRAFVLAAIAAGRIVVDGKGRRVPQQVAAPPAEDLKDLADPARARAFYAAVVLPDEEPYIEVVRALLGAATLMVLPWYRGAPGRHPNACTQIAAEDWAAAIDYTVEHRLILGDGVLFAFGRGRVRAIRSKQLIVQRLADYVDSHPRIAIVPAPSDWSSKRDPCEAAKELGRLMEALLLANPPSGIPRAELAAVIEHAKREGSLKPAKLARELRVATGKNPSRERVQDLWQRVVGHGRRLLDDRPSATP